MMNLLVVGIRHLWRALARKDNDLSVPPDVWPTH